jgi:hypothetical protein
MILACEGSKNLTLDLEGGTMFKKTLVVGLLGISLLALVGTEVSAAVCLLKNAENECKFWSSSVDCELTLTGVGTGATTAVCLVSDTTTWLVVCENNGGNLPSGINTVYFSADISGSYDLVEGDVDKTGKAHVTAHAEADAQLLADLVAAGACPNTNYTATGAVPCSMKVTAQEYENGCLTSEADFYCELPNCETLTYDEITGKFESSQYTCMRTATRKLSCP